MEINYFDIIVGITILLLGLKGIFNGFFKELFGLIGIIGGIFVASRFGDMVGEYLSNLIFHFSNDAAIGFTGFLVTLIVFWIVMIIIGYGFKRLTSLSGLGVLDRFFGFVFASGKFFLIAAVIAFAVNNVEALKPTLKSSLADSQLFPLLVETGAYIMKIDPNKISKDLNTSIENAKQKVSHTVEKTTKTIAEDTIQNHINEIKEELHKKEN